MTVTTTNLTEARTLALSYWADFGWPALVGPHGVSLQVQHQQFAVSVSVEVGSQLFTALDGEQGTVLEIPLRYDSRWVFLVAGDAEFPAVRQLPGVDLAPPGAAIPLPPTELADGPVRWIHRPAAGGDGFYSPDSVGHALTRIRQPVQHRMRHASC